MAALKVSLSFLEETVPNVIKKTSKIARVMTGNELFKFSPISSAGLQTAVDNLAEMEKKARSGNSADIENRNVALNDVVEFILQIAEFINHSSDPRKFTDNGFDFTADTQKYLESKHENWTGGLM